MIMRMMFELERPTKEPLRLDPIAIMLQNKAPKTGGIDELNFQ
jgi:hypothetical protein